ncbi:MAG: hypothetical protein JWR53_226 [Glaciihabitans sp.]|nr:hypothetical protein [Glaciihabitans sp.]
MPSYRVTMTMGALAPGIDPAAVLPTARAAGMQLTTVEAADVAVVAWTARITIRFTGEDAEVATQIASHIVAVTGTVAAVTGAKVSQRVRGDWVPVDSE